MSPEALLLGGPEGGSPPGREHERLFKAASSSLKLHRSAGGGFNPQVLTRSHRPILENAKLIEAFKA
eukprot:11128183-Alexandrium_andersonii.AAC.1